MAMSMNKVFISGRIKGDPYEVAGRHRQFTRFKVLLPRERNRGGRGEADSVLVEAVGRNGAQLLALKDGAAITFEGRLRTTVIVNGDSRQSTILVRLENFSVNVIPPEAEEDREPKPRANNEERPTKQRRRRNNRRRKNSEESGDSNANKDTQQSQDKGAAKDTAKDAPASEETGSSNSEKSASQEQAAKTPEKADGAKQDSKKAAPKVEAPTPPSGPPEMPSIKSVADETLKKDMPF
ncbi:MAG: single-stranded DNA-binding protein [Planctomycetota bacterium]|nr:single-stranded DNA-binding protein [Planctomycetota bacterium]